VENNISLGHYNMSFSRYHFNKLRMSDALKFAREALRLFRKAQDRDDVALALIQIAAIEIAQNRPVEASSSLDEAISTYEQIHCEYLKPFLMLGRGMLARSRTSEEAKSILTEGLRTSKKMGTREITWQIQRELALCYEDRGELNKALSCYRDAVETIKQITESIDDEQLKISYLDVPFRKRVFDEIKELKKKTQRAQ
jgi:tetratricopeptide (TPR) repeat protein